MSFIKAINGVEYTPQLFQSWWLNSLKSITNFKVANNYGNNHYSKWFNWEYNYSLKVFNAFPFNGLILKDNVALNLEREVLNNELLFDFDNDDYSKNVISANLLINRLKLKGLPYYAFFSGNKGIHISVFFDKQYIINNFNKLIVEALNYGLSFKDVLKDYFELLTGDIIFNDFIDKALLCKKHLIRCCGSVNPKSGFPKTFIDESVIPFDKPLIINFPNKSVSYAVEQAMFNDFPLVINRLINNKKLITKGKSSSNQLVLSRFFKHEVKGFDFNKLLSFRLIDGRKRFIIFVLIPALHQAGLNKNDIINKVNDWLSFNDYSFSGLEYHVDSVISKNVFPKWSLVKELKGMGVIS